MNWLQCSSLASGNLNCHSLKCAATIKRERQQRSRDMGISTALQLEDEFEVADKPAGPCVMVVFGAAGDLTKRKLVPALYNLAKEKLLPRNFAVLGVSVDELNTEAFRD